MYSSFARRYVRFRSARVSDVTSKLNEDRTRERAANTKSAEHRLASNLIWRRRIKWCRWQRCSCLWSRLSGRSCAEISQSRPRRSDAGSALICEVRSSVRLSQQRLSSRTVGSSAFNLSQDRLPPRGILPDESSLSTSSCVVVRSLVKYVRSAYKAAASKRTSGRFPGTPG